MGAPQGVCLRGGAAQSCAVHTVLCSPSQTPPGCEIRTFHRHHHPRDVRHGPPPQPPALLTSVASPGGCRMSPRFHPVCRRPGPGSPAESRVSATAPSPSPPPAPHPIGAAPHSRAWRGRDFWSPHRTCGTDGSVAMGQSGDGVRGEDGTATVTEKGEGWETNGVGNSRWELGTGNRDGER